MAIDGLGGGGGFGALMKNAFSAMTGLSGGDGVQKMLEGLGMGQQNAAFVGALHDLKNANLVGFQQNLNEALTGYEKGGGGIQAAAQALAAGQMCGAHHVGAPSMALTTNFERIDLKNMGSTGGAMATLGGAAAGFALGGPLGGLVGGALGGLIGNIKKRSQAKCLEKKLNKDPAFRAQFEASVGGKYVPDGRNDGKITIARTGFQMQLPGLNPGAFGALGKNLVAGSVMSGMFGLMNNIAGLAGQLGMGGQVQLQGQALSAKNQWNPTNGFNASANGDQVENNLRAKAAPGSMMSKLPQPCAFEDFIAAFMFDTVKEMQNEVKKLMAEFDQGKSTNNGNADQSKGAGGEAGGVGGAGGAGAAGGAGRAGRSRGGYAGGLIKGVIGTALPIVGGMIGGPIGSALGGALGGMLGGGAGGGGLGGMLGGLLGGGGGIAGGLGGMLGNAAGGLLGGGGAQGAGGGGMAQGAGGAGGGQAAGAQGGVAGTEDKMQSRAELFERLKMLMQKLQEMQQSLSNILNVMHEGAMGTIRNIRG